MQLNKLDGSKDMSFLFANGLSSFAYAWNAMLCFPNKWNERKILEWIYPHFVTITQAVKKESDFTNIRAAVFF